MPESHPAPETAAAVLGAVRSETAAADRAEAHKLLLAVDWASMHSVDSITHAAVFADTAMTVAGPGAPMVSEFCVAEFAAAIGLPTEAGKAYLGEGVELRYRLPKTW
ncbi:MAG: endonuclease, partial [Nocardioides sp.]|nr:endonuclease [Nocardioides sp.]